MPVPVYGVVYGSLIVGVFIGMIVGINSRFTQRKKLKALEKENRNLKAKVSEVPEEKAVAESVAEEKEPPPEETEEVTSEFEPKEEPGVEKEEEEKETRFWFLLFHFKDHQGNVVLKFLARPKPIEIIFCALSIHPWTIRAQRNALALKFFKLYLIRILIHVSYLHNPP